MERDEIEQCGFAVEPVGKRFRVRHADLNPIGPFRSEAEAWRAAGEQAERMFLSQEIVDYLQSPAEFAVAPRPDPEPEDEPGDETAPAERKPKPRRVQE